MGLTHFCSRNLARNFIRATISYINTYFIHIIHLTRHNFDHTLNCRICLDPKKYSNRVVAWERRSCRTTSLSSTVYRNGCLPLTFQNNYRGRVGNILCPRALPCLVVPCCVFLCLAVSSRVIPCHSFVGFCSKFRVIFEQV